MLTSYHVHSTFSDGAEPVSNVVRAAVDAGLDEIGLSDHYVLSADGSVISWSIQPDGIPEYFDHIREAAREFKDRIVVRYGLEADYIPETQDQLAQKLSPHSFDYIIGSVHFVDGFPIDESADFWESLSEAEINDVIRAYWARVAQLAQSGLYDIAGHLDLYKKFGNLPTVDISEDIAAALDAVAKSGMTVELNTSGWFKPAVSEAYPSSRIIDECFARNIPMLITADAHRTENLTRDYERGVRELARTGYTSTPIFERRRTTMIPLRAAAK